MSRTHNASGSTTTTRGRGAKPRSLANVGRSSREATAASNANTRRARQPPGRGMWNPNNNLPNRSGGAGRGNRPGIDPAAETEDSNPEADQASSEQQLSHLGAFSMLTPNQAKRQQIISQAQRETQQYEAYKEKTKLKHVSYVGTVGGGEKSEAEARRDAERKQANAKLQRLKKQQQWQEQKKVSEDSVYEQKKLDARRQSELKEEKERRREEKLKEDMRRKRSAFLDKLESQKPASQPTTLPFPVSPGSSRPIAQHRGAGESSGMYEALSPGPHRLASQPKPYQPPPQPHVFPQESSTNFRDELSTDFGEGLYLGTGDEVSQLSAMFPNFSPEVLADIFQQTGSLDAAASLLMEMQE
ncbi:nucleosome-remodeling factor subunit NURF301-like [Gigantopelta aegis]|uniref:nucleosome-remodeling factor subunit NURF301-like n=1 Tax=Gigantopelta aegis TaxID=1735272 RepID=UPI001B88843B|nr:nucleosome-remodeling factor subunit NURF301-like [Gigantopelta aegis]